MIRPLAAVVGALLASMACPLTAQTYPHFDVIIQVSPAKPSGSPWDAGSGPDIVLCVGDSLGQRCITRNAGAKGHAEGSAWCKDLKGDTCVVEAVPLPDDKFQVRVIDKDVMFDDTIATGSCRVSATTCDLGLAKLMFRRVS